MKIEHRHFETPGKKHIEVSTISSNYHIEVNPSDAGIHDYTVVRNLLKEIAQTYPALPLARVYVCAAIFRFYMYPPLRFWNSLILSPCTRSHSIDTGAKQAFKLVVINEADKLTKDAQHALRRIMEKYVRSDSFFSRCVEQSNKREADFLDQ